MNGGGYIPRHEASRYTSSTVHQNPEGDSCFSIYQISWIEMKSLSSAFLRSCYKFSIMMTIIFYLPANSDKNNNNNRASDISRKKSKISRDFQGQIRGRKVKSRRKIGRFHGILAEKSQISKDFQGQILRKIG